MENVAARTARLIGRIAAALAVVGAVAAPAAHAQVFLAPRPEHGFAVGPLFVRATVGPNPGPITVDVLWSLVVPPGAGAGGQDFYLLWPGAVTADPTVGKADPALAAFVEARGLAAIEEGRLPLSAERVQSTGRQPGRERIPGGAPFVTFVRQGGPFGLTAPATYIRIPWNPRLANREWLMDLQITSPDLVRPKKASWVENVVQGQRRLLSISFNDVRSEALFPLYFEHRDRVVRLADEPSQLLINFAGADRLKIDEVSPPSSSRRLSESLENTEVVSHFLDPSEGITPQILSVQFTYFSGIQSWAPILIPTVFFLLGNLAAVVLRTVADRVGRRLAGRFHFGRPGARPTERQSGVVLSRETLARIVPGVTTYDEVLQLCGPDVERIEKLGPPAGRTLIYRGRRVVPQRRRVFGWLTAVTTWDVEHHDVQIDLEGDVVGDVQAKVRRTRLERIEPA
jgi:hypothetical protein